MSNDDSSSSSVYDTSMAKTVEEFRTERRMFEEMRSAGGLSREDVKHFASKCAAFRHDLYTFHDDNSLEPDWEQRDLDWIQKYEGRKVEESVEVATHGAPSKPETVPALSTIPAGDLSGLSSNLLRTAADLNFGPSTPEQTPGDEAGMADLRGLLKARGQSEALENLPGGNEQPDPPEEVVD